MSGVAKLLREVRNNIPMGKSTKKSAKPPERRFLTYESDLNWKLEQPGKKKTTRPTTYEKSVE